MAPFPVALHCQYIVKADMQEVQRPLHAAGCSDLGNKTMRVVIIQMPVTSWLPALLVATCASDEDPESDNCLGEGMQGYARC